MGSLARPGWNVTGLSDDQGPEVAVLALVPPSAAAPRVNCHEIDGVITADFAFKP